MLARLGLPLIAVIACLWAAVLPAGAQEDAAGASFITPFPPGDTYNLVMIGDDLAEGLLAGAREIFQKDPRLVIGTHLAVNGLMRSDYAEKLVDLEDKLKTTPPQIAILMMGAWDRVSVRHASGKRLMVGTDAWRQEYAARADRLLKILRKYNIAVYWLGLPNVRRYDANEDVQMMNNTLRERVYLNGAKYIDTYAGFADENGGYSAYGPDVTGKIRLLRSGDGVYFTYEGNRKLAYFVDRELRRDITQARADRAVPLDGAEADQAKINPGAVKLTGPAAPKGPQAPVAGDVVSAAKAKEVIPAGIGDQKADNGKINLRIVSEGGREEIVALDIVRPAIPASVVALVTRRESADRASQLGESIVDQISGGLTVMSTVALATGGGTANNRRALAPSQSPYFRVLFKGERLPPKPGRADDSRWPRPAPPPEQAYVPLAEPLETGATPDPAGKPGATKPDDTRSGRRKN
ncbi:MAG: DUF459 domain-containing protein [Hyphomicrobium sp.]|jgi:hypothetical protein|uniref:SGNH/GDSL hydrolase family protein n=1 Tax=Hyphomicrobium sp. TaxID=82 RepID=UPI0025BF9F3A|nr:DUF459 domain-containing protein [Hyphomicrobium sp.]MBX9862138.1 DUF459 domain-containing protein [Hyphomicrobium sp.]